MTAAPRPRPAAGPAFAGAPAAPSLAEALLRALAELLPAEHPLASALADEAWPGAPAAALFDAALLGRSPVDAQLIAAAHGLGLGQEDICAMRLALLVEDDARAPAALRALQGEGFGSWPCNALLWRLQAALRRPAAAPDRALSLGLLLRVGERAPGPEIRFALAPAPLRALRPAPSALAPSAAACERAEAPATWRMRAGEIAGRVAGRRAALVLRSGELKDRERFAELIAEALGRRAEQLADEEPGLGAACRLGEWLPVEHAATQAGRRTPALALAGHDGPRILLANREGGIELRGWEAVEIAPPPLAEAERRRLWRRALGDEPPPGLAAAGLGPARIAAVGARVALADPGPLARRLREALGAEFRAEMEPHALIVPDEVEDAAFAAEAGLRGDLELLLARCRFRAAAANPVPGVRALLSGPSGAGKTLAVAWLATRLGLPLFRVDLASVVSKWIGETEENLARLLDRAESGDMVLLLDEADSLFGARTEARDGSDRFANNQTNYLLSRIEGFEGIAILTSNAPERIDGAFQRRLDQVISVPLPAPPVRRAIWLAHLPERHALAQADVNRLAALVDLAGGSIRNIAQTARVLAGETRAAGWPDLLRAVEIEYRKLGRSMPAGLGR